MEALPIISGAEQQENREQPVGAESVIVVQGPPPTEEQVISQVMTKARQNRQSYIYQVLQTIQMKLILLCVWAEPAVLAVLKLLQNSYIKFK